MTGGKRTRRTRSYWEPIYNPQDYQDFPHGELNVNHTGCKHSTIDFESLLQQRKISAETFDTCDFAGLFTGIVLTDCSFVLCDFGLSTWKYGKFSRCSFAKCSFTQASFINCDFRDCKWIEISMAGNETNLQMTTISNPCEFIEAAYTNLNESTLKAVNAPIFYQKVRLQRTKANVARKLLNALATKGEESWYYEAIKIYTLTQFRACQLECALHFVNSKNLADRLYWAVATAGYFSERKIVGFLGFFNRWGASLFWPCFMGLFISVIFATIYRGSGISHTWPDALLSSAEITLVAGYTKHAMTCQKLFVQLVYFANMILGVFWLATVVPTLITRISRVR